jgi:hypothetical protein
MLLLRDSPNETLYLGITVAASITQYQDIPHVLLLLLRVLLLLLLISLLLSPLLLLLLLLVKKVDWLLPPMSAAADTAAAHAPMRRVELLVTEQRHLLLMVALRDRGRAGPLMLMLLRWAPGKHKNIYTGNLLMQSFH